MSSSGELNEMCQSAQKYTTKPNSHIPSFLCTITVTATRKRVLKEEVGLLLSLSGFLFYFIFWVLFGFYLLFFIFSLLQRS